MTDTESSGIPVNLWTPAWATTGFYLFIFLHDQARLPNINVPWVTQLHPGYVAGRA